MVTLADAAQHAGVSASTVSYVLSGKRSISASTRERVERSIAQTASVDVAVAGGPYGYATLVVPLAARGVQDLRTALTGSVRLASLGFTPAAPAT
jgi:transcriptional regulator with XRE-family HTH domain